MCDFSDLVQSAEALTSEFDGGFGVDGGGGGGLDLPRVERNLKQIVEAGSHLYAKAARDGHKGSQDVKASILLGSKGVDLPGIAAKLESLSGARAFEPAEPLRDTDVAGFLRNERENAILSVIEETRRETIDRVERLHWDAMAADWETDKRRILQALVCAGGSDSAAAELTQSLRAEPSRAEATMLAAAGGRSSALDHTEIVYAKQVTEYNEAITRGGLKPDLASKFAALFPEDKDQEVALIWQMVREMAGLPQPTTETAAAKHRATSAVARAIVAKAKAYLESAFFKFARMTVLGNLQRAQLGGVPGTGHIIRSFINIKIAPNTPGLEDSLVDGGIPVWPLIYYCLRCGDVGAAAESAGRAGPGLDQLSKHLAELAAAADNRLSPQSENAIRLLYRRSVRQTTDPFKRAVYCVLGACDPADEHAEVAGSLDDYLWIKLSQIRDGDAAEAGGAETLSLASLQTMMSEEYGETHFNAYEQPALYFQVLFLTGQFESAVEFLFRVERLRPHALHIALVLYEAGLLLIPANVQAPLLSRDPSDRSPLRRLNVARLVIVYVRKFEASDPQEALQYFYFLRALRGSKNENLFMSCVSELVLASREYDLLLGYLAPDGSRCQGLVDRFEGGAGGVDTAAIIEIVAQDSEQKGMFEDSVKLYDLAHKHEKVIELLNKLLAQVISQPSVAESRRERLQRQAVDMAKRYRTLGHAASQDAIASFFLLLDLMTFFDLYHTKKHEEAIDTIGKIKIVPLLAADIDPMVSNFRVLSDEVRRNIPDILLAAMNILFHQYKQTKAATPGRGVGQDGGRERHLEMLRDEAKAIITFAGMIPYRMPGDTNARLVQMEVLMN